MNHIAHKSYKILKCDVITLFEILRTNVNQINNRYFYNNLQPGLQNSLIKEEAINYSLKIS